MLTTSRTRFFASAAAVVALAGGGVALATGPANAGIFHLPDVTISTTNYGPICYADVTNIGDAVAKNVTVHATSAGRPAQNLGALAPGETKRTSQYIDCLFEIGGWSVFATTSNGDSNPFNNYARMS